jgi:hypothetical protein
MVDQPNLINEYSAEELEFNVTHFISLFCDFHKAYPNENKHIIRHVMEQVLRPNTRMDVEYAQSKRGQEPICTFERGEKNVRKRVFHPGRGETISGADFVLQKKTNLRTVGGIAVQVKRNRGKGYYEFERRDIDQLERLADFCRSAYYLMVDESVSPPIDCFLTVYEVRKLISNATGRLPIKISNSEVSKHCRGPNIFYDAFYKCQRGATYPVRYYLESAW